jgi:hypothetical protein
LVKQENRPHYTRKSNDFKADFVAAGSRRSGIALHFTGGSQETK